MISREDVYSIHMKELKPFFCRCLCEIRHQEEFDIIIIAINRQLDFISTYIKKHEQTWVEHEKWVLERKRNRIAQDKCE
jgi:hypothetical protein